LLPPVRKHGSCGSPDMIQLHDDVRRGGVMHAVGCVCSCTHPRSRPSLASREGKVAGATGTLNSPGQVACTEIRRRSRPSLASSGEVQPRAVYHRRRRGRRGRGIVQGSRPRAYIDVYIELLTLAADESIVRPDGGVRAGCARGLSRPGAWRAADAAKACRWQVCAWAGEGTDRRG